MSELFLSFFFRNIICNDVCSYLVYFRLFPVKFCEKLFCKVEFLDDVSKMAAKLSYCHRIMVKIGISGS